MKNREIEDREIRDLVLDVRQDVLDGILEEIEGGDTRQAIIERDIVPTS